MFFVEDAALTGGAMRMAGAGLVGLGLCAGVEAGAQARGLNPPATAEEARRFVDAADARLLKLANSFSKADWVKSTHITDDTEALAAEANERLITAQVELAKQATRFDGLKL